MDGRGEMTMTADCRQAELSGAADVCGLAERRLLALRRRALRETVVGCGHGARAEGTAASKGRRGSPRSKARFGVA